MQFDRKTIITILASVAGVIVLGGIIGFVSHARFEGRNFRGPGYGNNFTGPGCGTNVKGNQAQMMSGLDDIIATKDYTEFQMLFSGSRMLQEINTPEKFATRVELQTTIKKTQELQAQLSSGNQQGFFPMMFGDKGGSMMPGGRGNMTQVHPGQGRRR